MTQAEALGIAARTTQRKGLADPLSVGCLPATIAAGRCWPGVHGSDQPPANNPADDNFNSAITDEMYATLRSVQRRNGMGVNWLGIYLGVPAT